MLNAKDLVGLYAIIPTPAKDGANRLDATNTVDLDETARLVNTLIADGCNGLIALGTTGECATLSQPDYEAFADCVLKTVARRIPTFIGASALGGHEAVRRLKFVRDRGADGTLLGLPMWQPVTDEMAIRFYREVSELFPDLAIMVYANSRAFRYAFPPQFWQAVSQQAPTVMSAKYSRAQNLAELIASTGGRIHFLPNETAVHHFHEQSPATTTACWATAAAMGPAPILALMDALLKKDEARMKGLVKDLGWASEPVKPIVANAEVFATCNIQLEKIRINEAGYCKAGPVRPPYDFMPPDYEAASRECGRRWKTLQEKYRAAARPVKTAAHA